MKIAIACDHGGLALKRAVIHWLEAEDCSAHDFGCYSVESVDYPDFAFPAAEAVARGEFDRGVVICTTGIGVSICVNKVRGIRCALCTSAFQAEMTRRHNDANMLALGAKTVSEEEAEQIVKIWLRTPFEGGRHARRIGKITAYENKEEGANECRNL